MPLLLVDADPVGGLTSAIGETTAGTLASVKEKFIQETRERGKEGAAEAAENLNYFILNALVERKGYSLLAMGHTMKKKGCFCSAKNTLLRSALDQIDSRVCSGAHRCRSRNRADQQGSNTTC